MIDEISMMDFNLLELLDHFLRVLMEHNVFMGGKLIILMHDFRQTLHVVPGASQATIVSTSVLSSESWAHFTSWNLTKNTRLERLLQVGGSHRNAWLIEGIIPTGCCQWAMAQLSHYSNTTILLGFLLGWCVLPRGISKAKYLATFYTIIKTNESCG